ncbi:MAG: glycosyltransferase 87 family protein [Patescibacteria group bacterium]|mgnify:CR=1 FL=1
MKKFITIVLTIGIILRLILSSVTYHSDVVPFDFAGRVIASGNVINFYDYLWDLPEDHPYLKTYPRNLFNYPPLPYFFLGGFSLLTTWIVYNNVHDNFILNFKETLGNPSLNLLLLLLKLPYFIFDIAIAYLLMSFFKEEKEKRLAFALWIFNPVNLYATYMIGQFDIIPTFLAVAALYFVVKKDNFTFAAVLLGLGAGFKIFPLLFIIPLAFVKSSFWQRIKLILTSVITYVIFAYPFILSKGFRMTAALANQTTKSFYAQIPISGGESVILFLAATLFVYIGFYYKKTLVEDLWKRFFVMISVFFIFTHFHPQWFLWTMPFFVIELTKTKLKHWPLFVGLLVTYIGMITFFDSGLSLGLFAPINSNLYNLPDFWKVVGINLDVNASRSLLHSIFVGISAYYIYYYFPKFKK